MPKVKISDDQIQKLYAEVNRKTKNFSEITPQIISNNPQYMKIFRMLCNKSLTEMGNLLNKTYAAIAQYERGAIKRIPPKEAEKISRIIKEEMQDTSLEAVLKNNQKFKELSHGGYVQAFKRAEKAELTRQEKFIREILEKMKVNYEVHKTLQTSIGELNFDFWLPENKIVIECTESSSNHKAESLGFRMMKSKDRIKCKGVVVLPSNVSKGVLRRLVDYDHIIFSSDLSKLENIVE